MSFHANNFSVTVLLLLAFTVFIMGLRSKRPLENNWPMLYWLLVFTFVLLRSEETFNLELVLLGVGCGLLLRFEFMAGPLIKLVRIVELGVWIYILYRGFILIFF